VRVTLAFVALFSIAILTAQSGLPITGSTFQGSGVTLPTRGTGAGCHGFSSPITCTVNVTGGQIILVAVGDLATTSTLSISDNCGPGASTNTYSIVDGPTAVSTIGNGWQAITTTTTTTASPCSISIAGATSSGTAVVETISGGTLGTHGINSQLSSTGGTNGVVGPGITTSATSYVWAWTVDIGGNAGTLTAGTNIAWTKRDGDTTFPIADEDFTQSGAGAITNNFNYTNNFGAMVSGIMSFHN
jgi:hypothetical protein